MPKKYDDDLDERPKEMSDSFLMRQVEAAVDSLEWESYEITVTCAGRRISRGFEIKALKVSNKKISGQQ